MGTAVNKLGAQKCDGKAFPPEFTGLPEHLCLIVRGTAVYALINQRSFAEMGWAIMNLLLGIFLYRS